MEIGQMPMRCRHCRTESGRRTLKLCFGKFAETEKSARILEHLVQNTLFNGPLNKVDTG